MNLLKKLHVSEQKLHRSQNLLQNTEHANPHLISHQKLPDDSEKDIIAFTPTNPKLSFTQYLHSRMLAPATQKIQKFLLTTHLRTEDSELPESADYSLMAPNQRLSSVEKFSEIAPREPSRGEQFQRAFSRLSQDKRNSLDQNPFSYRPQNFFF